MTLTRSNDWLSKVLLRPRYAGFLSALVASLMNNMPSTLVEVLAINQAQLPAATQELMMYANVAQRSGAQIDADRKLNHSALATCTCRAKGTSSAGGGT